MKGSISKTQRLEDGKDIQHDQWTGYSLMLWSPVQMRLEDGHCLASVVVTGDYVQTVHGERNMGEKGRL